ncbi:MAG: DUF222 domain-containing protein [Jatrophihabitans sp.]
MDDGESDRDGEVGVPSPFEVLMFPDESLAVLARLAPSRDSLSASLLADPALLSEAGRVDLLDVVRREAAFHAARQLEVLATISRSDASPEGWSTQEIAAVLRIAPGTAATQVHRAQLLTTTLTASLESLREGSISARHTDLLASAVIGLEAEVARAVEDRVLERGSEQTLSQFRKSVTRAVLQMDPAGEAEKHADALAERRVVCTPEPHGMSTVWAYLPTAGAASLMTAVDALAAETIFGKGGDPRTADQRRADALVTMAETILGDPHLTRRHGARPAVQLTVAASTLLGLDEQPGELAGYGPIPAQMARRIADDQTGTWRRLITDDHGRLIDYGRQTYRPPARLAAFIIARDQTCTFASCTRPAVACDLDHLRSAKDGGPTCEGNLHPLCRRHHRCKHQTDWHPQRQPDGSTTSTSPTGHTFHTRPDPLPTTVELDVGSLEPPATDPDPPPF